MGVATATAARPVSGSSLGQRPAERSKHSGEREMVGEAQRDRETHMQERLPKGGLDGNGKCCGMEVPGEVGAERETSWERHIETRAHT